MTDAELKAAGWSFGGEVYNCEALRDAICEAINKNRKNDGDNKKFKLPDMSGVIGGMEEHND